MITVVKAIGIILVVIIVVFVYSLVRVAGMSERVIEQIHEEENEGIS